MIDKRNASGLTDMSRQFLIPIVEKCIYHLGRIK
jgi:hypothetical protein